MKTIYRIAKTEIRLFFYSPIAWLLIIIFILQSGMIFLDNLKLFERALNYGTC